MYRYSFFKVSFTEYALQNMSKSDEKKYYAQDEHAINLPSNALITKKRKWERNDLNIHQYSSLLHYKTMQKIVIYLPVSCIIYSVNQ